MVERAVAVAGAHGGARLDGTQDVTAGLRHGAGQGMAQGQVGGDGRRKRAGCGSYPEGEA